jgi:GNAT superfamily N-acetyltransferase
MPGSRCNPSLEDPARLRQPPSEYDKTLNRAALAWLDQLPRDLVPLSLAMRFPRIVNRLARFWDSPRAIDEYLDQLLVDRRGRRKGFPKRVIEDLSALARHVRTTRGTTLKTDLWESIPYRRPRDA